MNSALIIGDMGSKVWTIEILYYVSVAVLCIGVLLMAASGAPLARKVYLKYKNRRADRADYQAMKTTLNGYSPQKVAEMSLDLDVEIGQLRKYITKNQKAMAALKQQPTLSTVDRMVRNMKLKNLKGTPKELSTLQRIESMESLVMGKRNLKLSTLEFNTRTAIRLLKDDVKAKAAVQKYMKEFNYDLSG